MRKSGKIFKDLSPEEKQKIRGSLEDNRNEVVVDEKESDILETEKEALIQNDGKKVEELLSLKEDFIRELEEYDLNEIDREDAELISLTAEIKDLQETNLLLTEQAMSYNDQFISAFQKEAQKSVTYSDKNKKDDGQSSILNQSL